MKRVVSLSLIVLVILIGVAAALFYFQKKYNITGGKAENAIPADAAFFIETDISSGLLQTFVKTPYWNELLKKKYFKNVSNNILHVDSLMEKNTALKKLFSDEKLFISAHVIKANEFDLLYLINANTSDPETIATGLIKKLGGSEEEPSSRSYGDAAIYEHNFKNGTVFTWTISKSVFIGSFTPFLVEDAVRQQKVSSRFFRGKDNFREINSESLTANSIRFNINYQNLPAWLSVFKDENSASSFTNIEKFAAWSSFVLHFSDEHIQLEGSTVVNDSADFAFALQTQQPVNSGIGKMLPRKTAALVSVAMSDKAPFFNSFKKHLQSLATAPANNNLLNKIKSDYKLSIAEKFYALTGNEFGLIVTEPGSTNYDNNCYFILKTTNGAKAKKTLQDISLSVDKKENEKNLLEKYNGFSIGLIRLRSVIPALYGNMFKRVTKMYYTFMGDYVLFANQAISLRTFIDDYTAGNLLMNDPALKPVVEELKQPCNYFVYDRIPASNYIFKAVLANRWDKELDSLRNFTNKCTSFSFRVNGGSNKLRTTAILQFNAKSTTGEATLLWSAQLDTSVTMKPQVIRDVTQNTSYVMVQDESNQLYLLDNSGNIVWKKQFPEKIISDIQTIDLYKNNSSQYIFNSAGYLFVIDINGNAVSNYPINLPATATTGIAVFDLDKSNDYRIYVPCSNGKIFGYDGSGKPLPGWTFDYITGIINRPVQLFSINGKNYLVASDNNGSVFILDRTGQMLINTNGKVVRKAGVDFYLKQDADKTWSFVTLDATGNIVEIGMNGEIETNAVEAVSLSDHFTMADINKDGSLDYIFGEKEEVNTYTQQMALLFHAAFPENEIYELKVFNTGKDNVAVGAVAKSSNKIFLLKSDGSLYKGFPVKGSTAFEIEELNNDGKLYLIAGSNDGSINVYSVF